MTIPCTWFLTRFFFIHKKAQGNFDTWQQCFFFKCWNNTWWSAALQNNVKNMTILSWRHLFYAFSYWVLYSNFPLKIISWKFCSRNLPFKSVIFVKQSKIEKIPTRRRWDEGTGAKTGEKCSVDAKIYMNTSLKWINNQKKMRN